MDREYIKTILELQFKKRKGTGAEEATGTTAYLILGVAVVAIMGMIIGSMMLGGYFPQFSILSDFSGGFTR